MFDFINGMQDQISTLILLISLVFYLVQTLFGYKLFKISCAIVGFIIGLILGIYISGTMFHLASPWPPIIGIVAGILIGFLAFKLFLLGLFVLAFLIAFGLAVQIPFPDNSTVWNIVSLVIALAIAIFAGILAVKFQKIVIIVITAIGGAFNAVTTFNQLTDVLTKPHNYFWLAAAILAAIGLLIQFLTNRNS